MLQAITPAHVPPQCVASQSLQFGNAQFAAHEVHWPLPIVPWQLPELQVPCAVLQVVTLPQVAPKCVVSQSLQFGAAQPVLHDVHTPVPVVP